MTEETLADVLRRRAEEQPDRLAYAFLPDGELRGEETEQRLTYAELHAHATSLAARLQQMGAQGSRALLLYPTGLDYVTAFFGCLCAGTVAVPAYPPRPTGPCRASMPSWPTRAPPWLSPPREFSRGWSAASPTCRT